jgi:hypothetical protein
MLEGIRPTAPPHGSPTSNRLLPACWLPMGFTLVDLANQDRRALARCENRGGSVAECRLVVLGR